MRLNDFGLFHVVEKPIKLGVRKIETLTEARLNMGFIRSLKGSDQQESILGWIYGIVCNITQQEKTK